MKSFLSLVLVFCLFISCKTAQQGVKEGELTISFVTINTIEGYDHISKLKVFCDEKLVGESSEKKQSVANKVTVKLPKGNHTVKTMLFANYNNNWEERTLANDYSFDFQTVQEMTVKSKNKLDIVFDIEAEKTIVK
jgi:hypothetical protein